MAVPEGERLIVRVDPAWKDADLFVAFFGQASRSVSPDHFVIFRSGGRPYSVPIGSVVEVIPGRLPLPVPGSSGWVGAISWRGEALPVKKLSALGGQKLRSFIRLRRSRGDVLLAADDMPQIVFSATGTTSLASFAEEGEGNPWS